MSSDTKFKALVHYICSQRSCAPDTLGAVKLNKILWLADLSAFHARGRAITHSRYIKREFGPVPARIVTTVRELEKEGVLSVRETNHFGRSKKEYVVHVKATPDFLPPDERVIVDNVINHVCGDHTASSVSEATHDHIWRAAEDGEEIPLFTVFAKPGKITDAERKWARMKISSETT